MFKIKFHVKYNKRQKKAIILDVFNGFNELYTIENLKLEDLLCNITISCFKKIFIILSIKNYSGKIKQNEFARVVYTNISNGEKNRVFEFIYDKINYINNYLNGEQVGKQFEYDHYGNIKYITYVNDKVTYKILDISKSYSGIITIKLDNDKSNRKTIRFEKSGRIIDIVNLGKIFFKYEFDKNNIVRYHNNTKFNFVLMYKLNMKAIRHTYLVY